MSCGAGSSALRSEDRRLAPGGELLLRSQAADGSTANALYTVRGVLKGISDGVDRGGVCPWAGAAAA